MKNIKYRSYFLALLMLCCNGSYSSDKAEQSLFTQENINLLSLITTLCGIGFVLYKYEARILKWLDSVWFPIKKNPKKKSDEDFDFSERENEIDDQKKKINKYNRQKRDG